MLAAKLCNTNCDRSDLPTQIIFLFCQQEWCLLQPRKCIMNTNGSLQPFKVTVVAVEVSTVFMKPDWWRVSRLYTQKWVDRCLWVGGRRYQVVKRKYRFFGQLKRVNLLYSWNKGRPDLDSWVRSWSEGNFARYSSKQTKKIHRQVRLKLFWQQALALLEKVGHRQSCLFLLAGDDLFDSQTRSLWHCLGL